MRNKKQCGTVQKMLLCTTTKTITFAQLMIKKNFLADSEVIYMYEINNLHCMQIEEQYKNRLFLEENRNDLIKEQQNKKKRGY